MTVTSDLCEHWVTVSDHRCHNRWRQEIVLDETTRVGGHAMIGTYGPGTWRFCNMHAAIFNRDKR